MLLLTGSCHKKSDAERAAEERAQARKRVDSSLTLVPYRSLKTVVRASAQTPPPPELQKLVDIYAKMTPVATPQNALQEAENLGALAMGLFRARSLLNQADEDRFPTLWNVFQKAPPPVAWYSSKLEHLALCAAAILFEVSLDKQPAADVLFYEIDRAPAEAGWPPLVKGASQGGRGLAYMSAGFHYAAEEELTGFLDGASLPELQIAGHLARAWNRFALGRDDPANDDLEAALTRLDELGVDDELVDWGWALVHARRGRYQEASQRLGKLAQSPYLSDGEKAQIREYAATMQTKKGAVLFGKERAQLILLRAVIARQGGVEKLLCRLLGDETGKQLYQPLAFLHRITHAVSRK